jgi:hypothetical protein
VGSIPASRTNKINKLASFCESDLLSFEIDTSSCTPCLPQSHQRPAAQINLIGAQPNKLRMVVLALWPTDLPLSPENRGTQSTLPLCNVLAMG